MNRKPERRVKFLSFETTSVAMKAPRVLLLILPVLVLSSCSFPDLLVSTTPHTIKLKNGGEVRCNGVPQYQEQTGYYRYRTPDKRDALIRADEVATIVEQRA